MMPLSPTSNDGSPRHKPTLNAGGPEALLPTQSRLSERPLSGYVMLSTDFALEALTLGENTAASLGVNLVLVRLRLVTGAALAVGSDVAVSGAIGFIGRVVPQPNKRRPNS